MEQPQDRQFESQDELIQHLKERIDDIDDIRLFVATEMAIRNPDGVQTRVTRGAGGQLVFCTGQTALIHLEDMERLINDGILHRMGIKISLRTLPAQE